MNTQKAFTLVELLCVIAIVILLSALTIPALQRSGSTLIATSGAGLASLMESSRATAIATGRPVAVAMLTVTTDLPQRFTTLAMGADGTWKQNTKWDALPAGIVTDSNALCTGTGGAIVSGTITNAAFQATNSPPTQATMGTLPTLEYAGTSYGPGVGYGYVIFRPDGSLYKAGGFPPFPCVLRIVEGTKAPTSTRYKGGKTVATNYLDIVLIPTTGQVKVVRP